MLLAKLIQFVSNTTITLYAFTIRACYNSFFTSIFYFLFKEPVVELDHQIEANQLADSNADVAGHLPPTEATDGEASSDEEVSDSDSSHSLYI